MNNTENEIVDKMPREAWENYNESIYKGKLSAEEEAHARLAFLSGMCHAAGFIQRRIKENKAEPLKKFSEELESEMQFSQNLISALYSLRDDTEKEN